VISVFLYHNGYSECDPILLDNTINVKEHFGANTLNGNHDTLYWDHHAYSYNDPTCQVAIDSVG